MAETNPDVSCSKCGTVLPRSEMFGMSPELLCPDCAHGHRKRLQVRIRSLSASGKPVVTYSMIGIAVGLFVICILGFQTKGAFFLDPLLGELYPGIGIWDGEVWRLLSSAFLHWSGPGMMMNLMHLFFNCWWMLELGRAFENGFGRVWLVLFVVGCAMVATGLEWMMKGGAVGLSGVVFGLALFLFVHRRTNPCAARVMNRRTLQFLGIWFVLCLYLTWSGAMGVANWGHGGGALWGFLVGQAALHRRRKLLIPAVVLGTVLFVIMSTQVAFGNQARLREQYLHVQRLLQASDAGAPPKGRTPEPVQRAEAGDPRSQLR